MANSRRLSAERGRNIALIPSAIGKRPITAAVFGRACEVGENIEFAILGTGLILWCDESNELLDPLTVRVKNNLKLLVILSSLSGKRARTYLSSLRHKSKRMRQEPCPPHSDALNRHRD